MDKSHIEEIFSTSRLLLRKYNVFDAPDFSSLLQDKDVAATTLMLPHPINIEKAEEIIGGYLQEEEQGSAFRWAVILKEQGNKLIGGIRLVLNDRFNSAELGFWIGKAYWRKGYTFEAAKAVIRFGFCKLGINRLEAHSMVENEASIVLLKKLGFHKEGYHPDLVMKWGEYKDVLTFGMLRKNYQCK